MKERRLPVAAVGFSDKELDALECIFQLSERYRLLPLGSAELAAVALVNIDENDAVSYWKSKLDRSDLTTVVVAEELDHYGNITYLPKRFVQRPRFAKQVLSVLDSVAPVDQAAIASTEYQSAPDEKAAAVAPSQVARKLNRWVDSWFKTEQRHNPYYTA